MPFEFHKILCPKIWEGDSLKPEVRKKLLRIAEAFAHFIQVGDDDVPVVDIIFVGSLANYNYSDQFSDIDLHLVVDFSKVLSFASNLDAAKDYLAEFYVAKKSLWNSQHNLAINGFPVELYAQDADGATLKSSGVYSIMQNEWIERPQPNEPGEVDENAVEAKTLDIMAQIDYVIAHGSVNSFETLKEKIRRMRQAGLDTGGEWSVENLCFKELRRSGYIEKLWDAETKTVDKELTVEGVLKDGWRAAQPSKAGRS